MDYIFMLLIAAWSFYNSFLKQDKEDLKDLSEPEKNILKYLLFGSINSFFAGFIFDIEWFYWITLYSLLGFVIGFESGKVREKIIISTVIIFLFSIFRVPIDYRDFEDFVNSTDTYQCISYIECVKTTSIINEEDAIEAGAEIMKVKDYGFKWYCLFAKSYLLLETNNGKEELIRGVNIAGVWIKY